MAAPSSFHMKTSVNHPVRYYLVTHTGRKRLAAGRPDSLTLPGRPPGQRAMKYYAVESTIITLTICRSGFRRRTLTLAWSGRIFLEGHVHLHM